MLFGLLSFLLSATNTLPSWVAQPGIASLYYPGDGHCGKIRADGRRFRATDIHVAHRSLPLGIPVIVENMSTGQWTATTVQDRGPFGYCLHKTRHVPHCPRVPRTIDRGRPCPATHRWVVRTRLRRGECGYYRGVVDLTLPVARKVGIRSFAAVRLWAPKRRLWRRWLPLPDA